MNGKLERIWKQSWSNLGIILEAVTDTMKIFRPNSQIQTKHLLNMSTKNYHITQLNQYESCYLSSLQ